MDEKNKDSRKKNSFWQNLKDFFTISEADLKGWKKEHYESRQQMGFTSRDEDEEYNEEWERKNKRY
jgi:hypothetical protein